MNANLQKYLKYKSKYLDLKNELMGGKNYAELNGGGDKEIKEIEEIEDKIKLLKLKLDNTSTLQGYDKISEEITNLKIKKKELEDKHYESLEAGLPLPLHFKPLSPAGRTVQTVGPEGRTVVSRDVYDPIMAPSDNAFGALRNPLKGSPHGQNQGLWGNVKSTVSRALSPYRDVSPPRAASAFIAASNSRDVSPPRAASGVAQRLSLDSQRLQNQSQRSLQAPETKLRNESAFRHRIINDPQSQGRRQETSSVRGSKDYGYGYGYDDANEAGAGSRISLRYSEQELETERILKLHDQNQQKLLDNITKRKGVNKSQISQSITQFTSMLEKDFNEIEKDIKTEEWFTGLKAKAKAKDNDYKNHLNKLKMFINREQINAYTNLDNFFKLIDFFKEQFSNDSEIMSFLIKFKN